MNERAEYVSATGSWKPVGKCFLCGQDGGELEMVVVTRSGSIYPICVTCIEIHDKATTITPLNRMVVVAAVIATFFMMVAVVAILQVSGGS